MAMLYYESSFAHHGIKGQKWGVRRFQNPDGTLTKAGRSRVLNQYRKNAVKNPDDSVKRALKESIEDELKTQYVSDIAAASNDYKRIDKPFAELRSNEKMYDAYAKKAAKQMCKDDGFDYNDNLPKYVKDHFPNLIEIEYAKDNKLDYDRISSGRIHAFRSFLDAADRLTNDMLKSYGQKPIRDLAPTLNDDQLRVLARKSISERYIPDINNNTRYWASSNKQIAAREQMLANEYRKRGENSK